MAMVGVDSGIQANSQPKSSGLVLGRRPFGAVLHSSNEPGELSQWLCHDDSTINIVLDIIIFIILYVVQELQSTPSDIRADITQLCLHPVPNLCSTKCFDTSLAGEGNSVRL